MIPVLESGPKSRTYGIKDAIAGTADLLDSLAKEAEGQIPKLDPASADIFTRLTLTSQKYAWLVRAKN